MRREELFNDVRAAHENVDRVERIVAAHNKTGSVTKGGCNTMYSKWVGGSVSNEEVFVGTSTLDAKPSNGSETSRDVVSVMIDDGTCEEPKEAFLTSVECMELIRSLATAATLLRD